MASVEPIGLAIEVVPEQPRARRLLATLLETDGELAPLVLRIVLGAVMFPHGAQKALGWFGGAGFEGTMSYFTGSVHLPALLGYLVIAAEFLGSLLLLLGLFTRCGAASIALVMAGAATLVHAPNGFFMNWFGNQAGEGFEFHLIAIAIAAALVLRGGGRWSLDGRLLGRVAAA